MTTSRPHRVHHALRTVRSLLVAATLAVVAATILVLVPTLAHAQAASTTPGRLSARHSFQPPYDVHVPNWRLGAGAVSNGTFVRLTPPKQSRTGFIWSAMPSSMSDWEVEFEFRVEGLLHLGGDGFAFWYTEQPEMIGNVYGSIDFWTGLGVFFDTFNNDGVGSSPLITAVYNDGTQRFDSHSDGASQALASCSIDIRNQVNPSVVRIRYERKVLTVQVSTRRSSSNNEPEFQLCFTVSELELGVDKYFGVTAHTGEVADSHDILSLKTTDLSPVGVDLAAIRQQFQSTLQRQHASPSHQEMTAQNFQHTVLTSLSQMQEELNLVQLNSLSILDLISNQVPIQAGGVRPGGGAAGGATSASSTPSAADNSIDGQQLVRLQQRLDQQSQQFGVVSDQQTDMLREVRSVQQSLNTVLSQLTTVSNRVAGASPSSPSAGGGADETTMASLRQVLDSVNVVGRRVDELASAVTYFKEEELRLTNQLLVQFGALQASINEASGGGGLSWFSFLLLFLTAVLSAVLTMFTFQQHMKNQRYKLI